MKQFIADTYKLAEYVWEAWRQELVPLLRKELFDAAGETIRTEELRDIAGKEPGEEWEPCEFESVGYALEALALHDDIQRHPAAVAYRVMSEIEELN